MPKLQSADSEMIYKVLAALDKSLGINTESEYDFVIGAVVGDINHYIGSKAKYMARQKARQAKTGKKRPTSLAVDGTGSKSGRMSKRVKQT